MPIGYDYCLYPPPHSCMTATPYLSVWVFFENDELSTAMKWWLGITPTGISDTKPPACLLCPGKILDPLCHHSTTFTWGGDVTTRHNRLRNAIYSACHRASLSASLEAGSGLGLDGFQTHSADILVTTWGIKGSAAFDVRIISLS